MRPHTAALYSITLFALLRPDEQVAKTVNIPEPKTDAEVGQRAKREIALQPSARSLQPDSFMYEFLRSEELAATPLLPKQSTQARMPAAIALAKHAL